MKLNKNNIYNYAIALTFLAIGATEIVPQHLQYVVALLGIFSFGILHGSNDIFVIENIKQNDKQNIVVKSQLIYSGIVIAFVAIFYLIPLFALIAFILISGYHFGEQHFHSKFINQASALASLFYLSYGLFILFLLFYFNIEEVITIIKDMTGYIVPETVFPYMLVITFLISLILFFVNARKNPLLKFSGPANLLYIALFSFLFFISDVVWSFAVYFVVWHSLPSLKDQINSIYGKFNLKSFVKYFKKAFPYWLASIIGMVVVVWLFKDSKNFLSLLFAFIAAITFPHVFIMRKLFDHN